MGKEEGDSFLKDSLNERWESLRFQNESFLFDKEDFFLLNFWSLLKKKN